MAEVEHDPAVVGPAESAGDRFGRGRGGRGIGQFLHGADGGTRPSASRWRAVGSRSCRCRRRASTGCCCSSRPRSVTSAASSPAPSTPPTRAPRASTPTRSCRTRSRAARAASCAGCTGGAAPARPSWCAAPTARSTTSSSTPGTGSPTFGQSAAFRLDDEIAAHALHPARLPARVPGAHGRPPTPATASTPRTTRREDVSVAFDDPELAIAWPLPPSMVSDRDRAAGSWADARKLLAPAHA